MLQNFLNSVSDCLKAFRLRPGVGYRVRETTDGTFLDILFPGGGGGGAVQLAPFQVYSSPIAGVPVIFVKVKEGTIFFKDIRTKLFPTGIPETPYGDSTWIFVPTPSTSFKIWLTIDNEFSAGGSSPPNFTLNFGADGWSGYPDQPNPPAVRHWLLAELKVDSPVSPATVGTLTINQWWTGHIKWDQGYFWL